MTNTTHDEAASTKKRSGPFRQSATQAGRIEDLVCDDFERDLLPVARHLMMTFSRPEQQTWQVAYSIAVERWGERIGLPAAHGLSEIISSLLRIRVGGLDFQDPLCLESRDYVTDDETQLIRMIHHMRRGQTPAARYAAEKLTRGRMESVFIRHGLAFAARFSCGLPQASDSRGGPGLVVVK